MKENKNKIVIIILVGIILILSGTYAWLTIRVLGEKKNTLVVGTLSLNLKEENFISIENAMPIEDKDGLKQTPYTFEVVNDGTIDSEYEVYLDDEAIDNNETRMNNEYIKYNFIKNGISNGVNKLSNLNTQTNRLLDKGTLKVGEKITYNLRLWIDKDTTNDVMKTVFSGKIRIESSQIKE